MGRPVIHWEINAKDAKKLGRFYTHLFDWSADNADPDQVFVDTDTDEGIDGSIAQVDEGDPLGVTFYVAVDELEPALRKVQELGGEVRVPPTELPDGSLVAVFADPEGNEIGLVENSD